MTAFHPWDVVHLSLRDRLPDLTGGIDVGGLFVVFWCDDVPVGQLLVPGPLLPIPSAQLAAVVANIVAPAVGFGTITTGFEPPLPVPLEAQAVHPPASLSELVALERPLAALAASFGSQDAAEALTVSVVIYTRNRPEPLENCLRALEALSPAPTETLIIDNEPESGQTRRVTDRFPEVRYVPEPRPGLSVARNTGVLSCTSALVAFTDDDVIVHPRWIGAIRDAFRDPDLMAMTGLVLPAELATPAQHAFQTDAAGWGWGYRPLDFSEAFFRATKAVGVPAWRMGAGANMVFRREAFNRVGLFDERLGAGASGCSEDSELWYRLLAEGHRCRYWPAAVVHHRHRVDWEGLRRQLYQYMRGHVAALLVQFERHRHWGNLYRAFVALPWYLLRVALHENKRRCARLLYDPRDGVVRRPVTPQVLGALAGYAYYVRHRSQRSSGAAVPAIRTRITAP